MSQTVACWATGAGKLEVIQFHATLGEWDPVMFRSTTAKNGSKSHNRESESHIMAWFRPSVVCDSDLLLHVIQTFCCVWITPSVACDSYLVLCVIQTFCCVWFIPAVIYESDLLQVIQAYVYVWFRHIVCDLDLLLCRVIQTCLCVSELRVWFKSTVAHDLGLLLHMIQAFCCV